MTKLEKLLEEIDPSRSIDVVEKNINNAVARIQRQKNTVNSRWGDKVYPRVFLFSSVQSR